MRQLLQTARSLSRLRRGTALSRCGAALLLPPVAVLSGSYPSFPASADRAQSRAADAGITAEAGRVSSSGNWLATAGHRVAAAEYEITWQNETALAGLAAAYQAPNRAHGLRTYFTPEGIHVIPRSEGTPSWQWRLTLTGVGRPGAIVPVEPAVLRPDRNRIEYERGEILEWYVNDAKGLEQGFTLRDRPGGIGASRTIGDGDSILMSSSHRTRRSPEAEDSSLGTSADPVVIEMALGGTLSAYPTSDKQSIEFRTSQGVRVLLYAGLRVVDASARELPASMEAFDGPEGPAVRILLEDSEADYPVTIDPLATSPVWTAEGNQAVAGFGTSVATAGDVNGDGYSDLIVGAHLYDNGQTNEGRAYVYLGSASGLAVTPAWTAESDLTGARLGASVGTAGDVNGDGYSDVVVGAPAHSNGQSAEGRAFVYLGSPSGLATSPIWTAESNQASAEFGISVATAGDVNGDGYSDVIVGADLYDGGQTDEGRVYVFHGSASGPAASPAFTRENDDAGSKLGFSVATAGDVNGDGYSDVIVGAPVTGGFFTFGTAYVWFGSAAGLGGLPWSASTSVLASLFGTSVGTAGDVNGDGYADVIVGAPDTGNGEIGEGRALVYLGSATGPVPTAAWQVESNLVGARFGASVATAGDVNGDGYADIVVGARTATNIETGEGEAFVYLGSAGGLSYGAAWTAEGNQESAAFGFTVATAGDVNGDGYGDVVVGAPQYSNGESGEGGAFVFLGSAASLATSPGWTAEGNQESAYFGVSVAPAGDVNGDGYADVIVGAMLYDNGQMNEGGAFVYLGSSSGLAANPSWTGESNQVSAAFGIAVNTAGDVNGDGYADVIVGAHFYDNGQVNEGRAFVYLGSAAGLAAAPAWTAEINEAMEGLGASVATAGDVNGDGYSDVIVGNFSFDSMGQVTSHDRAFVYQGSASGLSASPVWVVASDQAEFTSGLRVASAGDVNRDGYSDVIIGDSNHDSPLPDEGRAFVYFGSPAGLSAAPGWTAEGDQPGEDFGAGVASAGDVNGDGYADVIVAAPGTSHPPTSEGSVHVYLGSASGPGLAPAWTVEGAVGVGLGPRVGSAGDVNGDGYSDVIVSVINYSNGESFEGGVLLYEGSQTGLATSPAWTAEGNQALASFGYSAAGAGDVDGDGFSDVVVGAPFLEAGQIDEGRTLLYHGNNGPGLSLRPEQRVTTDAAPIAPLGSSDSLGSFRLALQGRTPFGRGRVRLEWEVKPMGSLLDGSGTSVDPTETGTGIGGTRVSTLAGGLSSGTLHLWKARLRYNPVTTPFAQSSRWATGSWNGLQEPDVRTAGLSSGRVPEGAPFSPLLVSKAAAPSITLTWSASCAPTDSDYAVYEGVLGSFTSHVPRACSTGGATSATLTPLSGDRYYLIVPRNAAREGSYGAGAGGSERPASLAACLPRSIAECP